MIYSLFFGALGLFLLGMWMMTEGLKLAGGQALKHLLGQWTSTRVRGLLAGTLVTALVQSSSAVTVATIGFVNTRLMSFNQSLWVVYGSNVGTTFTAWIVTIFGLKVDMGGLTYFLIGVGAVLRVFARYERGKAFGMAIAGFGILFLGISQLQSAFAGFAKSDIYINYMGTGNYGILWGVLSGLILTILTQSSSAAIALVLTALSSSVIDLQTAASAVIGANVGTTSTAILSVLGATANAKRLAIAHLIFNLLTGSVALLILPVFLAMVMLIASIGFLGSDPTILLAIFHTLFNVTGVCLIWPLTPSLAAFLQHLFQRTDIVQRTKYLDRNVATIPDLALRALNAQLHLLLEEISNRRIEKDVKTEVHQQWLNGEYEALEEVGEYLGQVSRTSLSEGLAEQLTQGLAIQHYLHNACQALENLGKEYRTSVKPDSWTSQQIDPWLAEVSNFTALLSAGHLDDAQSLWSMRLASYRVLKNTLLKGATNGRCSLEELDAVLQIVSLSKRYVEQLIHTLNRFAILDEDSRPVSPEEEKPAAEMY